jgi:hypothetical protein
VRTVIVWALAAATLLTFSKATNANDIFVTAFGNSFEMLLIQKHGSNDLDLSVIGDYHIIEIVQDGDGNIADITIDGTYPTDLYLYQDGNNLSYILNQYCTNSAGCAINVVQY